MLLSKGVFALLGGKPGVEVLQLLRRDKSHITVKMDVLQLRKLPAQLIRGRADCIHDVTDGLPQKIQRALFSGNNALPVPLVYIDAVQVVQLLITADGVHIGHKALTGAIAVLVQGIALPFGKAVNNLGLLIQAGNIERNRALHTVQVIIQTAALYNKEGSRDALEMQCHAKLFLKDRFDQADGLLGVIQPQQTLVPFRNDNAAHSRISFFFPRF